MRRRLSITLALLTACATPEDATLFVADVAYDTVAFGGGIDETNPLLIYQSPLFPKLVDESTVVFGDGAGGRLIAVDLVSGEGWEMQDHGAVGPGEFGGRQFWLTEDDGLILTASQTGEAAARSLDGELLQTRRYPAFLYHDPSIDDRPVGLLDDGVMVVYFQEASRPSPDPQELRQGLRAYSPEDGLIWSNDAFPPLVMQWHENDGIERTSSYLVLDRDLNMLMRVTERGIEDARGDRILTGGFDALDVRRMYLLERTSGR